VPCLNWASSVGHPACIHIYAEINTSWDPGGCRGFLPGPHGLDRGRYIATPVPVPVNKATALRMPPDAGAAHGVCAGLCGRVSVKILTRVGLWFLGQPVV
jgi:hypothetical protein